MELSVLHVIERSKITRVKYIPTSVSICEPCIWCDLVSAGINIWTIITMQFEIVLYVASYKNFIWISPSGADKDCNNLRLYAMEIDIKVQFWRRLLPTSSGQARSSRIPWRWKQQKSLKVDVYIPVYVASYSRIVTLIKEKAIYIYRDADKSLARPVRNKLGCMSGTRAISTTSRRELSSSFFSCNARRRRKFTPFGQKH